LQHNLKQIMLHKTTAFVVTCALFLILSDFSARAQDWKAETKVNVLFGLSQPLVTHGFNFEFNYIHNRLIIDFSQGVALEFTSGLVTPDLRRQGVDVHMPWTTGFGVGYRITSWLNLRAEPKWHRFEFYYDNQLKYPGTEITSYNTFTMGLGLYGAFQPFKKKASFLSGILIAPSIRYWPTVASNLKGNQFTYYNQHTGKNEEIKTVGPGIGLTPLVINVSIGYSFPIKKKKK
jgi:hypothetical protein